MTMRSRRGGGPGRMRSAGPRRKTTWLGVTVSADVLTDGTTARTAVLNVSAFPELIGGTLVRIRGAAGARNRMSSTIAGAARVTMGLIMVSDAAAAALVIPNPDADIDASWLWHTDLIMQGDATNLLSNVAQVVVDNRAMRKLGVDEQLVFSVINNANVTVDVTALFRFLIMLP